jgi:DNA-binding PadR family transcriptional regulator
MKEELELLQKLAKHSTTRYSDKVIYRLNNGVADLNDLINGGYIRVEQVVSGGEEEKWYKITLKGWDFLNQLKERKSQVKNRKWQIGLTIAVLILTLAGLIISILK